LEKDYYKILGVERSASHEQITIAYRKLASQYHPDKHLGNPLADLAEEKFKEINEAYHALIQDDFPATFDKNADKKPRSKKEPRDIPPDAKDLLYRGVIFYNEGKYKPAIQSFETALHYSKSPTLYNLLGLALCEGGEYRKAVDSLVQATKLDEENGKYYFDAGYAFYHLKLWDAAIQYLLDAYNLLGDSKRLGTACVYIAVCNYNIGKSARAEFFLEEAVNFDPENSSYRILLEEFKHALESDSQPKLRILNKINRFSFASRLEDSIGNLFKTIFSK